MENMQINAQVHVVHGAVNMGLVRTDAGFVAIDTGLDKRSGKALNALAESLDAPICAIINTHAHADHYGGNTQVLNKHLQAVVYAPVDEAPIIRRPRFEAEYLWQGTAPFADLQNKFLMADPSPVHRTFQTDEEVIIGNRHFRMIPLPGHAHGQAGVLTAGVLFAADAYFDDVVTDKHGLPYMVNLQQTLDSAGNVLTIPAEAYVPGHGEITDRPDAHVNHLVNRHREAVAVLVSMAKEGFTLEQAVQNLCDKFGLHLAAAGAYLLVRTTVGAYLTWCVEQGIMKVRVEQGALLFQAGHPS